ncbi:hypothetical protein FGO68_gene3632 [Halteria grandinella]|uniref:Uncharacterized protein n=1 Tax=Halteria grandinella TaxID=5974 RepID=A0A8J8NDS5_HALGN|nr:hypothetical protein FGO68_gene3632 [Halteria grandinella]
MYTHNTRKAKKSLVRSGSKAYNYQTNGFFNSHNVTTGNLKSASRAMLPQNTSDAYQIEDPAALTSDLPYQSTGTAMLLQGQDQSSSHFSLKKDSIRQLAKQLATQQSVEFKNYSTTAPSRFSMNVQYGKEMSLSSQTPSIYQKGKAPPSIFQKTQYNGANKSHSTASKTQYDVKFQSSINPAFDSGDDMILEEAHLSKHSPSKKASRDSKSRKDANNPKGKITKMRDQLQLLRMKQMQYRSYGGGAGAEVAPKGAVSAF